MVQQDLVILLNPFHQFLLSLIVYDKCYSLRLIHYISRLSGWLAKSFAITSPEDIVE